MKFKTHQFVIPAKAGTQEKVEKKKLSHISWEKIVFFERTAWFPAFAGMTNWGNANAYIASNSHFFKEGLHDSHFF
jgi:hypothetical protein